MLQKKATLKSNMDIACTFGYIDKTSNTLEMSNTLKRHLLWSMAHTSSSLETFVVPQWTLNPKSIHFSHSEMNFVCPNAYKNGSKAGAQKGTKASLVSLG